jgi:hypothetical protein
MSPTAYCSTRLNVFVVVGKVVEHGSHQRLSAVQNGVKVVPQFVSECDSVESCVCNGLRQKRLWISSWCVGGYAENG